MNTPLVSIIIPNYNHAQYLEKRIDTVLNQTYQNIEVIILDDQSTDNSLEVIKKYRNHPKIAQIVVNERNTGNPFKQWDKGIRLATYSARCVENEILISFAGIISENVLLSLIENFHSN